MNDVTIWDLLTWLWNEGLTILNLEFNALGLHFTLWEFTLGFAILDLLLFAFFRSLE